MCPGPYCLSRGSSKSDKSAEGDEVLVLRKSEEGDGIAQSDEGGHSEGVQLTTFGTTFGDLKT